MSALTQGDLQIQSVIPVIDIQYFHMEQQTNAHASFHVEGIIPEEEGEEALLQPLIGTVVKISADNRTLFTGIPEEVYMIQEGRGYQLSMTGVSATKQLDYQRKNRSFQDVSMTYRKVMEQVLADTQGAKLYFHETDQTIGEPLYQIEETDWEFMKRLAGRLHVSLVSSVYSTTANIHIGLPDGSKAEADIHKTTKERIWFDRKSRSICCHVRTEENWEIGDRIRWEGRTLSVESKECSLENGLLQFYYTLAGKVAFRSERYENPYLTGLLLPATVLDVQEEQVKVKFDMDEEQSIEGAYWYPWRPDMGNLAYCMPEKGELIYVHIGDAAGKEDRAVCGVHRNGNGNAEMDHTNRYFTTKDGKRMYLTPDAVGFQDMKQEKTLRLELQDVSGASAVSHRRLTIRAKDTIGLKAGSILMQAPQEISLVKKAFYPTVINMCNGFDTIGTADKVTMQGAGGDYFPVFGHEDTQSSTEYVFSEPEQMQQTVIASTPVMELTDSMERVLEGCQVRQLGVVTGN
ncbi:MAG: contractile injection system protein, VgrG/Pvc8 family [Lachnospiraceae bacterium]|nr:contractile injection system protein, VgrG/Pvc8 family [Lachnospiraceae bacterium]